MAFLSRLISFKHAPWLWCVIFFSFQTLSRVERAVFAQYFLIIFVLRFRIFFFVLIFNVLMPQVLSVNNNATCDILAIAVYRHN